MRVGTRTTIVLDEESQRAARELAAKYACSVSEAIRRAIVQQRSLELGVSEERRKERLQAFKTLITLFEGNDAAAEIQRLKDEDENL